MAAAVRMGTWSCPTRGVLYLWAVLFILSLGAIHAVNAAPETGLWKITVFNVSIFIFLTGNTGNTAAPVS